MPRDLYNLPASSGAGTINKITVYARFNMLFAGYIARIIIKTGGVVYESDNLTPGATWNTVSWEWAQNPGNAHAWTWDEIDALQIGIYMQLPGSDKNYCTQVYVVIDYEEAVGTNTKVNISDVFKDISEIKVNIGDVWKDVTKIQINIGDVWKTVFG